MGGDTLSYGNSVTITWDREGTFDITVKFYNDCYLLPESYEVYVIECIRSAVYFANAFTPNGDGKNDTWSPIGFGLMDIHWYIFDRWGLQIYEADSPADVWDGCMDYKGERRPCQADVYVWLAYWNDAEYGFNTKTGRVTIVR
jgi:gliding motility-associated-like protein